MSEEFETAINSLVSKWLLGRFTPLTGFSIVAAITTLNGLNGQRSTQARRQMENADLKAVVARLKARGIIPRDEIYSQFFPHKEHKPTYPVIQWEATNASSRES